MEIIDDGKMVNHSENPNCKSVSNGPDLNSYALRDIAEDEEIFEDYGTYEYEDWFLKICDEYKAEMEYFTIKEK